MVLREREGRVSVILKENKEGGTQNFVIGILLAQCVYLASKVDEESRSFET